MNRQKKILIIRTDRIGDVVLTLPLAKILKSHFPNAMVTYLINEYTSAVFFNHPHVDKIITIPANKSLTISELKQIIKKNNFDICINVSPKFSNALSVFLSGIKTRIGTGYRWYSFLFNKRIYEHRKDAKFNELEYNIHLLNKLGINENVNKSNVVFGIQSDKNSEQQVQNTFSELNIDSTKKNLIIHPGSRGSSVDWPFQRFKELVNLLAHELDFNIFLTGSKKETDMCEKLKYGKNTFNLSGKFNLKEFISLINLSDLLISNSTGPIHIAAALNKNVIGFYPKVPQLSAKRWGPYTNKAIIFEPEIDCSNCTRKKCEELNCMNSILPEKVFSEIKKIIG